MSVDATSHLVVIDVEDRVVCYTQIQFGEEIDPGAVGDDHLAVGVPDVASQLRSSPGGIHTDDASPHESCTTDPKEIVGNVLEQDADMWRPSRVEGVGENGGSGCRLPHDLVPRPDFFLEPVADRRVADAGSEKFTDGAHGTMRSGSGWRKSDAAFVQQSLRRTESGKWPHASFRIVCVSGQVLSPCG